MCLYVLYDIYVTVTWNYVNWIWLNLLESYWYEKHTKIKSNKKDKKLVNITRIILVDITESHDFFDFTSYL